MVGEQHAGSVWQQPSAPCSSACLSPAGASGASDHPLPCAPPPLPAVAPRVISLSANGSSAELAPLKGAEGAAVLRTSSGASGDRV